MVVITKVDTFFFFLIIYLLLSCIIYAKMMSLELMFWYYLCQMFSKQLKVKFSVVLIRIG